MSYNKSKLSFFGIGKIKVDFSHDNTRFLRYPVRQIVKIMFLVLV